MRGRLAALALALLTPTAAFAQHFHHQLESAPGRLSVCVKDYATPTLDSRLPKVPWDVTGKPAAKDYFQQGVALYYGFNYEDALRNFRLATDIDDQFVMGWWGRALAAGPNINLDLDNDCMRLAREWSGKAWTLAQAKFKKGDLEYELAHALMVRYAGDSVATEDYAKEMAAVWEAVKVPADPNVGALYAESLMDKWPWDLWTPDHKEKHADTHTVLEVLREVIRKHPDALGAHHYFVHAVEAGPNPGEASDSALWLHRNGGSSGHLQHMPSHTWLLGGDYAAAVNANDEAIRYDREFREACFGTEGKPYKVYIDDPKCLQLYYGHYLAHNYYYRAVAKAFLGWFVSRQQIPGAGIDARLTRQHVERFVANEPGLQRYMTAWLMLSVADGQWNAILDEKGNPLPPEDCYSAPFPASGCRILRSMWYWARGMAYTSKKDPDLAAARREREAFRAERARITPPGAPGPNRWGNNTAVAVLAIAENVLEARIDWAGLKYDAAVKDLQAAVAAEDALVYDEPPQWMFPVRESLGGAYLELHRYAAAADAFRCDLTIHKKNGRSLFGLATALQSMVPPDPAWKTAWDDYEKAWGLADSKLTVNKLWLLGLPPAPPPPTDAAAAAVAEPCPTP